MWIMGPVDLKKKYKAQWALVTGAGTGIGKSIAETLALQGLNIVLVSLPDKFLEGKVANKSFIVLSKMFIVTTYRDKANTCYSIPKTVISRRTCCIQS